MYYFFPESDGVFVEFNKIPYKNLQVRSEMFSSREFMSETIPSVVVKHKVSVEECGVQNRICSLSSKSTVCEET